MAYEFSALNLRILLFIEILAPRPDQTLCADKTLLKTFSFGKHHPINSPALVLFRA